MCEKSIANSSPQFFFNVFQFGCWRMYPTVMQKPMTVFQLNRLALLASFLFSSLAFAQLFEVQLPAPVPKPSSIVYRTMKVQESKGQWLECAHSGRSGFAQSGIVKGWILKSWIRCAYNNDSEKKRPDEILAAIRSWNQNTQLRDGPWKNDLMNEIVRARLWVVETVLKTNPTLAKEYLTALFEEIPGDDKKSRARAWAMAGDMAQIKHDLAAAADAFEQSLKEKDDKAVSEKYSSALLALSRSNSTTKVRPVDSGEAPPEKTVINDLEKQYEERFRTSGKENDLMILFEDCVAYLNALPNGLKSKWAASKILEIHQTVWDRLGETNPQDKWKLVYSRVISTLEKIDQQRILDWLPVFFRRGDYEMTLRLADRIKSNYANTVSGSTVLWLGGRSAQLTGNSKKVEQYFTQYLEMHGGGEMARDVQFHLAMTYLRTKSFPSAIAILERLLQSPQVDRMELNARYWMVRALQATQNPRAIDESRRVIDNFPFSYYGIRLRAELQNGNFEWPFASKSLVSLKAKIHLNAVQKRAWDRMQWLRGNGWILEAQAEAQSLAVPADPTSKVLFAQELSKVESYPSVIKLLSDAGDAAPDLRSSEIIQLGLPQIYQDIIAKEAKKRSMNPILVRSLIRQESAFFPRAVSSSNALGLMQLIPPTAKEVAQDLKISALEIPEDVFSPPTNVQMGTFYLAKLLKQFDGSVPVALASYNAGPRRMQNFLRSRAELRAQAVKTTSDPWDEMWIDELPWAETTYYVKAILRNTILYKTLEQQRVTLQGVLWQDLVLGPNSGSGPVEVN